MVCSGKPNTPIDIWKKGEEKKGGREEGREREREGGREGGREKEREGEQW